MMKKYNKKYSRKMDCNNTEMQEQKCYECYFNPHYNFRQANSAMKNAEVSK